MKYIEKISTCYMKAGHYDTPVKCPIQATPDRDN